MSVPDVVAMRERLIAQRAAIEAASSGSASSRAPVELDQTSVGRVSRIDAIQVQAMAIAAERRRAQALRLIEEALARIDAGTYGDCVACGEPIAPRRLALDPAVPTCVSCAAGRPG